MPAYAAALAVGNPPEDRQERLSHYTASVFAALATLFLFFALREANLAAWPAFAFAMVGFFGTCLWSVASKGLFQHGPAACFLALAIWMLLRDTGRSAAVAGLALGLAVVIRPTNLAIALPLAVFVVFGRRRQLPAFAALAAVPALLNAAYAWKYWGTPFSPGESGHLSLFGGNPLHGLAGLLVSPSRGLFVFSPFLLFAIPAALAALRRSAPALDRALAVGVLAVVALYAFWEVWWGGHSFGYRLLTDLAPILVFLIARAWPELRAIPAAAPVFAVAAAASVFANFLGATVYPSGFNYDMERRPELLWSVSDGEIARDARLLFGGRTAATAVSAPSVPGERAPSPEPVWWNPDRADEGIPAAIDFPRADSAVRGELTVAGWAGSSRGPVEVAVAIAPGGAVLVPSRHDRGDVCRIDPELVACPRVGFAAAVGARPARARRYALCVEIKDVRGCVRRIGPIAFFWND